MRQFKEKHCSEIYNTYFENLPRLSIVYLNLKHENDKDINDSLKNQIILVDEIDEENSSDFVHSEVDWSDFYTHELYDTVIEKIENLKQYYKN